jgi:hypothetical protein
LHGFEVWHKDFYNGILQDRYLKLIEKFPQLKNA